MATVKSIRTNLAKTVQNRQSIVEPGQDIWLNRSDGWQGGVKGALYKEKTDQIAAIADGFNSVIADLGGLNI